MKELRLVRETLSDLSETELSVVVGGTESSVPSVAPRCTPWGWWTISDQCITESDNITGHCTWTAGCEVAP